MHATYIQCICEYRQWKIWQICQFSPAKYFPCTVICYELLWKCVSNKSFGPGAEDIGESISWRNALRKYFGEINIGDLDEMQ